MLSMEPLSNATRTAAVRMSFSSSFVLRRGGVLTAKHEQKHVEGDVEQDDVA